MKDRRPRKLKKIAKKRKAAADALVMFKSATVTMQGAIEMAMISATPVPIPASIGIKALKVAETAIDTATAIKNIMSEIKPWREFAR